MSNRVLIISPHPDDETLGAGGTILKHKENGDEIYWMIITNIHNKDGWDKDKVDSRQIEINEVAAEYNFKATFKLDFPTAKLDELPIIKLITKISKVINKLQPEVIYICNRSDVHTDHQIVFKAVISAAKSFRCPFIKRILMYETITETDFSASLHEKQFIPNVFVDITNQIENKIKIMRIYKSEIMIPPMPRSLDNIMALAHYRGSRIGVSYSEAFQLIFEKL